MKKRRARAAGIGDRRRKGWESLETYSPRQAYLLLSPILLVFILFLIIPILRLLPLSTMDPDFTLKHYIHLLETPLYRHVLFRTFRVSLLVTFFALMTGYPVAYLISQLRPPLSILLLGLVLFPMLTNWLVQVYAWVVLLQTHGVVNELLMRMGIIGQPLQLMLNEPAAVMVMVTIQLPLMILPVYTVLKGIDPNLVAAAKSLGASDLRAFLRVTLPLSLPGVATGVLFILILSLGYYVTPAIVGGAKVMLVGKLIEQQMTKLLAWPFASALAMVLLAMTFALVAVVRRYLLEKTGGELVVM